MIHLKKNAIKRKKIQSIFLYIDKENKRGISFFERFGYKQEKEKEKEELTNGQHDNDDNKNKKIQNGKSSPNKPTKTEQKNDEDEEEDLVKMILNLRLFKSTTAQLIKKEIKEQQAATDKQQHN